MKADQRHDCIAEVVRIAASESNEPGRGGDDMSESAAERLLEWRRTLPAPADEPTAAKNC